MNIKPAKASSYTSVKPKYIAEYIQDYSDKISSILARHDITGANKTRLKSIAANLETVLKELEYITEGRY